MSSASTIASSNLPHFAGLNWRLDVPRASRASAASGQNGIPEPVYSLRLALAHVAPGCFDASNDKNNQQQQDASKSESAEKSSSVVRIEDVAFSCTPETLIALAEAVEAAVNQSEQAPYRRILRLVR